MFCQNCGTKLNDGAVFCVKCGAKLMQIEATASTEEPAKVNISKETAANVARATTETTTQATETSEHAHYVPDKGLDQFFKTSGRLNRLRFFYRVFALGITCLIASLLISLTISDAMRIDMFVTFTNVGYFLSLLNLWPIYCLCIRRLQDMGKGKDLAVVYVVAGAISNITSVMINIPVLTGNPGSLSPFEALLLAGIWLIAGIVAFFVGLYLLFKEGTKGENQYGPDPIEGKH